MEDKTFRPYIRVAKKAPSRYKVTKLFITGLLKGLTVEEKTFIKLKVDCEYGIPKSGSRYIVTSIEELQK